MPHTRRDRPAAATQRASGRRAATLGSVTTSTAAAAVAALAASWHAEAFLPGAAWPSCTRGANLASGTAFFPAIPVFFRAAAFRRACAACAAAPSAASLRPVPPLPAAALALLCRAAFTTDQAVAALAVAVPTDAALDAALCAAGAGLPAPSAAVLDAPVPALEAARWPVPCTVY